MYHLIRPTQTADVPSFEGVYHAMEETAGYTFLPRCSFWGSLFFGIMLLVHHFWQTFVLLNLETNLISFYTSPSTTIGFHKAYLMSRVVFLNSSQLHF